jgi:hypothetical protein
MDGLQHPALVHLLPAAVLGVAREQKAPAAPLEQPYSADRRVVNGAFRTPHPGDLAQRARHRPRTSAQDQAPLPEPWTRTKVQGGLRLLHSRSASLLRLRPISWRSSTRTRACCRSAAATVYPPPGRSRELTASRQSTCRPSRSSEAPQRPARRVPSGRLHGREPRRTLRRDRRLLGPHKVAYLWVLARRSES